MDFIDEEAEPGNSAAALPATNLVTESPVVDQPHDFCLAQCLPQMPGLEGGRKIQQRPSDSRAGHAAKLGSVGRRKPTIPMGGNALRAATATIGCYDVNLIALLLSEPPEGRSGSVRENCTRPAGKNRGQECSLARNAWMPNGEDTLMNPVQAPRPDACGNRPAIHPQTFELGQRHQSMLAICNTSNAQIPPPRLQLTGRNVEVVRARG